MDVSKIKLGIFNDLKSILANIVEAKNKIDGPTHNIAGVTSEVLRLKGCCEQLEAAIALAKKESWGKDAQRRSFLQGLDENSGNLYAAVQAWEATYTKHFKPLITSGRMPTPEDKAAKNMIGAQLQVWLTGYLVPMFNACAALPLTDTQMKYLTNEMQKLAVKLRVKAKLRLTQKIGEA